MGNMRFLSAHRGCTTDKESRFLYLIGGVIEITGKTSNGEYIDLNEYELNDFDNAYYDMGPIIDSNFRNSAQEWASPECFSSAYAEDIIYCLAGDINGFGNTMIWMFERFYNYTTYGGQQGNTIMLNQATYGCTKKSNRYGPPYLFYPDCAGAIGHNIERELGLGYPENEVIANAPFGLLNGCSTPWHFVDDINGSYAFKYYIGGPQPNGVIIREDSEPFFMTSQPTDTPTNVPTNTPTIVPTGTPSSTPTENPTNITDVPSNTPTNIPTNAPTNVPTNTPTIAPTDETGSPSSTPTKPTQIPSITTRIPTILTLNPSSTPTAKPTQIPSITTRIPTILTLNPSITTPTAKPSNAPSDAPTIETNLPSIGPTVGKSGLSEFLEDTINVNIIIGVIFGICILLALIALLHRSGIFNKCCKVGDSDSFIIYIRLAFRLSDFVTDILFVLYLSEYIKNINDTQIYIIYITSIATLVIPFILNLLFTFRLIKYKKWFNNDHVSSYFYKNKIFIPISILTMDVLLALKFTKSKFLGLYIFDSGITSYEIYKFEYIKIVSITLFENIPTLIIQIIFITKYEFNIISLVSIVFSVFSVLITLLNYFMNRERVNESIPVSFFISFKVKNENSGKIKSKIGLQRKLKVKIFNIVGSKKFNDVDIGSINVTPFRDEYLTEIHCLSRMNDSKTFQFDPETVRNV